MPVFTFRMPSGIPGEVSRGAAHAIIVPEILDTTGFPTAFGRVVKLVSGKLREIASGDAASVVYGLNVRPFPSGNSQDGLGVSTPPTSGVQDVLRSGFMTVKVGAETKAAAAKGGQVYVRITASGVGVVGDIEGAADSAKCVAISGAFFRGAADADSNVEIEVSLT